MSVYAGVSRVVSLRTKGGNQANNQTQVFDTDGIHFYSYGSKVATIRNHVADLVKEVTLYEPYWNMYSQTTNYYLLQFLDEGSIKDIRKKVNSGDYIVDC